ncbi:MAG: hypothetical protein K1X78_10135 [Verrucomicrobiaceae bacterium]|nr:hypothetical protein [Verrucomicrobiaceae bacterium]
MSLIREQDFIPKHPDWMTDPDLTDAEKSKLAAMGFAEPLSRVECNEIHDDCFKCGEKLGTPYIYWQFMEMGISLHPHCAAKLALGLAQDARDALEEKRGEAVDAAVWLTTYAQKRVYGVEKE